MRRLKELRTKHKLTQAQVASELSTTQQSYARWESGAVDPPLAALRELALKFGTSVDYLLGQGPSSPQTTAYYMFSDDSDGFWGHLGLRVFGATHTRWYPITASVAALMRNSVLTSVEVPEWAVVRTLNNRVLAFRPLEFQRISLLDDAASGPEDDFEAVTPLDGTQGLPIDLYRAIEDWADEQIMDGGDFTVNNTPEIQAKVFEILDQADLRDKPEQVHDLLRNTTLHFRDGSRHSYHADEASVIGALQALSECSIDAIHLTDYAEEAGDDFFPTRNLVLMEVPAVQIPFDVHLGDEDGED